MATARKLTDRPYGGLNIVAAISSYEMGELDDASAVQLFQYLVDSGTINHLQGTYGRTAQRMIEAGLILPPTSRNAKTDKGANREPWQVDAQLARERDQ